MSDFGNGSGAFKHCSSTNADAQHFNNEREKQRKQSEGKQLLTECVNTVFWQCFRVRYPADK